jgi:hypothetical protein
MGLYGNRSSVIIPSLSILSLHSSCLLGKEIISDMFYPPPPADDIVVVLAAKYLSLI